MPAYESIDIATIGNLHLPCRDCSDVELVLRLNDSVNAPDKCGHGRPHDSRSGDRRYIPVITKSYGHGISPVSNSYFISLTPT
jgi:hypothetical protein